MGQVLTRAAPEVTIDLQDAIKDGALTGSMVDHPGGDGPAVGPSEIHPQNQTVSADKVGPGSTRFGPNLGRVRPSVGRARPVCSFHRLSHVLGSCPGPAPSVVAPTRPSAGPKQCARTMSSLPPLIDAVVPDASSTTGANLGNDVVFFGNQGAPPSMTRSRRGGVPRTHNRAR